MVGENIATLPQLGLFFASVEVECDLFFPTLPNNNLKKNIVRNDEEALVDVWEQLEDASISDPIVSIWEHSPQWPYTNRVDDCNLEKWFSSTAKGYTIFPDNVEIVTRSLQRGVRPFRRTGLEVELY